ncbi:hypothetical protein LSTR_LSTR013380 [Laodelphax striatellus]|uniref:Uncharacterized protein n=1 Tax=Laodelphax striatellus TaxID=195883 RepID=A0A482WSA6_LAOST|nr:hypothetical protein LSTR_LSTR013380 [Laodelphax striatellus]
MIIDLLLGVGPAAHLSELNIPVIYDSPGVALRYAVSGDGPLTSSVGLETVGFITTKYGNISDDWPDMEFMLTSTTTSSDGGTASANAHGSTKEFYDDFLGDLSNKDVFGVFQ